MKRALFVYNPTPFVVPTASSDDAATTAWVNAVVGGGGSVSGTQRGYVNTLITGLKADNLFSTIDALWLFASESAIQAKFDITAGTGSNLAITPVGSPTFTASQGYSNTVADVDYINTNYQPSTIAVHLTQNSATCGVYRRTSTTTRAWVIGGEDGVDRLGFENFRAGGVQLTVGLNDTGPAMNVSSGSGAAGFWCISRTGASTTEAYFNGSSVGTGTEASTGMVARPIFTHTLNGNGTPVAGANDLQAAIVVFASGWDGTQNANFYARIQAYMTSLGTQV